MCFVLTEDFYHHDIKTKVISKGICVIYIMGLKKRLHQCTKHFQLNTVSEPKTIQADINILKADVISARGCNAIKCQHQGMRVCFEVLLGSCVFKGCVCKSSCYDAPFALSLDNSISFLWHSWNGQDMHLFPQSRISILN